MIQNYGRAAAVAKSDTVNFDGSVSAVGGNVKACDALYVGGAGVVAVIFQDGTVVNVTAIAGAILPLRAIRVNDTNTTATVMVALYQV